ncbi:MATE family efflux transporter [Fusicatenibacter sp.]
MNASQTSASPSQTLDMTSGNILRILLTFALPVFFGSLLQQFYNLADTAIAGNMLGDAALAQIGATSALYSMLTTFSVGLNNGFAISVSRWFGAGDNRKMKQAAAWMMVFSLSIGLFLAALLFLLRCPLLRLLQTPDTAFAGALAYITVIFLGLPFTMLYNMEASLLRAIGNSVVPLLFLAFSSVLNIILDVWFLGSLHMGIQGAAIATVLAQAVSALLGLFYLYRSYPLLRFSFDSLRTGFSFALDVFFNGLSMALMNAVYNIGSVILQGSINALGSTYIAAQVGGRRLAEMFMLPGDSLGASMATYSSQNFGAGKRKRIGDGAKIACALYLIWWLAALLFTFTIAPAVIRLITGSQDPEVLSNALMYLQVCVPIFPPMGFLVILRNCLQGMHHRYVPLFCSVLELIGKILFALFLVPSIGYRAVCFCEPTTWIICCAVICIFTFMIRKEFRDTAA